MSSKENATNSPPEGPGHVSAEVPKDTMGGFLSIAQQKEAAERKYVNRAEEVSGVPLAGDGEDKSFMKHKPGGSETLPGWSQAKRFMPWASE